MFSRTNKTITQKIKFEKWNNQFKKTHSIDLLNENVRIKLLCAVLFNIYLFKRIIDYV